MKEIVKEAILGVLNDLGFSEVDFSVDHPADNNHGDYATNAALVAMQALNKQLNTSGSELGDSFIFNSPKDLAESIVERLGNTIPYIEKIEVAGPGFINFFLSRDFFKEKITEIQNDPDTWGSNKTWEGKKVLVEYTDPNPFKEFHIGHLFTNTVGESLSRLFMMAGADTKRLNYQGDVGIHVACAVWGMQELGFAGVRDFTPQELGKAYALGARAYKDDEKAKEEIVAINKAIYARSDDVLNALYDKGRKVSLEYFETIYALVDTQFDEYFFESETGPKGKELVLNHPDIFVESDGARVFLGEKYGLHTRVFLNSEGLPTYEAKELALAKIKEERLGAYDHSVISTSNEVTEYFKVLKKAMSFVYPNLSEKTEHIGHGTVRLQSGKMSSRTGDVITALDFIGDIANAALEKMQTAGTEEDREGAEDIALGAIKYVTLRGNILQDSVFDKERALSFEGDSGPYLMYTHARICSVLAKAQENGVSQNLEKVSATPYDVERILYQFPEVVLEALESREPHQVVGYLTSLAGAFNTFYANEKIADSSDEFAPYKCALTAAIRTTLKNGLWILAIKAPERM